MHVAVMVSDIYISFQKWRNAFLIKEESCLHFVEEWEQKGYNKNKQKPVLLSKPDCRVSEFNQYSLKIRNGNSDPM